jgi:hypothetical protein
MQHEQEPAFDFELLMRQQEAMINQRASHQARICLSLIAEKNWASIFGVAHASVTEETLNKLSALTFD